MIANISRAERYCLWRLRRSGLAHPQPQSICSHVSTAPPSISSQVPASMHRRSPKTASFASGRQLQDESDWHAGGIGTHVLHLSGPPITQTSAPTVHSPPPHGKVSPAELEPQLNQAMLKTTQLAINIRE